MCQRRYVDDILKRFGMEDCKAAISPADVSTRLTRSNALTKVSAPFREAVGGAHASDDRNTPRHSFCCEMSAPISWGSKKQSSVSLSTSKAEYIALSLAIQEGKWVHRLLIKILSASNNSAPGLKILEDNQSCIKMTKNPVNHGRAKHIDIKYHHIRDEVKRGEVELEHCETSIMLADILTKALPGPRHKDLTAALGIHASSH
ncbi:unnamed protein product [Peronospora belbahrii]|uniref:Uncharacterized protein n=2 Tax=Peronospora belbahrii TaxID=622444 RepID=A0AAU9KKM9_9STRA|nr:unnamed protein product [Peronospora belbahrii]